MADEVVNKDVDHLKTEILGLKIRIRRIEDFLRAFPEADDYLSQEELGEGDELLEEATKVVQRFDRASSSLLQRRLSIGYNRAARLLDILEQKGIVGPAEGSNPREVLIKETKK